MPAQVTIEVPDKVAEAIGSLDKPLEADDVAFESVIRWSVHQVHDELWALSEEAPAISADDLRRLSKRLEVLADACEAVED